MPVHIKFNYYDAKLKGAYPSIVIVAVIMLVTAVGLLLKTVYCCLHSFSEFPSGQESIAHYFLASANTI